MWNESANTSLGAGGSGCIREVDAPIFFLPDAPGLVEITDDCGDGVSIRVLGLRSKHPNSAPITDIELPIPTRSNSVGGDSIHLSVQGIRMMITIGTTLAGAGDHGNGAIRRDSQHAIGMEARLSGDKDDAMSVHCKWPWMLVRGVVHIDRGQRPISRIDADKSIKGVVGDNARGAPRKL